MESNVGALFREMDKFRLKEQKKKEMRNRKEKEASSTQIRKEGLQEPK